MKPPRALAMALAATAALFAAGPAASQDRNLARNLAANCANCHGTDGRSAGGMPALAGVKREEIVRLMREFREGKRPATIMHQLSKGYTDEQVELIAGWFAAQKAN